MQELKPCPFCGGKVYIVGICEDMEIAHFHVCGGAGVNDCKCRIFMESYQFPYKRDLGCFNSLEAKDARKKLVDKWNRRENCTCKLLKHNDEYDICSECGLGIPRNHGGWWFYCPGCGAGVVKE